MSASSSPPPTATPSMAATSGFRQPLRKMSSTRSGSPSRAKALRSMPAQKEPPAPVSTPTRRSSSASSVGQRVEHAE